MTYACKNEQICRLARILKTDLKSAVISVKMVKSILIFWAFYLIIISSHLNVYGNGIKETLHSNNLCVLYLMDVSKSGLGVNLLFLCVIPTMAYGTAIADDINGNSFWFWAIRCGYKPYIVSKFVACAITGFIVYFVGEVLTAVTVHVFFPVFLNNFEPENVYAVFLDTDKYIKYALLMTSHFAFTAMLYASVGMLISLFMTNRFAVYAMPVVIYFFISRVFSSINLYLSNVMTWLTEGIYDAGSWWLSIAVKMIVVVVLVYVMILISFQKMEKRN